MSTITEAHVGRKATFKGGQGTIRYVGETEFAKGVWVGLELALPEGKNDGVINGKRYFKVQRNHGIFVRRSGLDLLTPDKNINKSAANTAGKPTGPEEVTRQPCPAEAATARPKTTPVTERTRAADYADIVGECRVKLVKEYGVIHLKNALSDKGQQQLWNLMKPRVHDPSGKGAGMHMVEVSAKDHANRKRVKRVPKVDAFAELLFTLCADALSATLDVDATDEPSYQRLLDLKNGSKPFDPGEMFGLYYRADAFLHNHTDGTEILFTMTLAIGDDCDFHIGKPYRKNRLNERCGVVKKIRMRSGDAIFFDGGSTPHQVVRILEGTGPSWWKDVKVPNGSRFVMVCREQEHNFMRNKIRKEKKTKKTKGKVKKIK